MPGATCSAKISVRVAGSFYPADACAFNAILQHVYMMWNMHTGSTTAPHISAERGLRVAAPPNYYTAYLQPTTEEQVTSKNDEGKGATGGPPDYMPSMIMVEVSHERLNLDIQILPTRSIAR